MSNDDVEGATDEGPEVERHASWAELFFDLVAVAARTLWISSGLLLPLLLGLFGASLPATVVTGLIASVVVAQVAAEARLARRPPYEGVAPGSGFGPVASG